MSVDSAAERYASALFDLAREQGKVPEVDAELRKAALVSRGERVLARALLAPDIPEDVKHNIVDKVFVTLVSPVTLHFLHVLTGAGRFSALGDVARQFHGMMQDEKGQVQVDVDTAIELPTDLRSQVVQRVATHTGRQPEVRWNVDPELLGGVVVRIKDNIIDYSIKSQLHELRERLLRAQA